MGELNRIFIAVAPTPEARLALGDWMRRIEMPGRVVPIENWHLTLRFLGSIEEVVYERFLAEMSEAELGGPFEVGLGGLGTFPNDRKATVAWIDVVRGNERLIELADRCETAAVDIGIAPEERPFRAHLTLSRIRPPADLRGLVQSAAGSGISWRCRRLTVFESHLGSGSPHYEPLEEFDLTR